MLKAGRIAAAESLYFDAVRRAPRESAARLALGRFLAARGALKVGAALMEEARFFGGNDRVVAEQLVPVYTRLGDYAALASLPGSRLTRAERARAEWLRDHPPAMSGPDSAEVPYRAPGKGGGRGGDVLGRVVLRIGTDQVSATIDARAEGLTLDTAWGRRKEIRRFAVTPATRRAGGARDDVGVAGTVHFGAVSMRNVPVHFARQGGSGAATIGLSLLGRFAPTFDAAGGTLLLRKSGRIVGRAPGTHVPTVIYPNALLLARGGALVPVDGAAGARVLGSRRWTLDPARGMIVIAP